MSYRSDRDESAFRPLTDAEQQVLTVLLSADFPGKSALQEQATDALAQPIDSEGSLALAPEAGAPSADVVRRIPVEAELEDLDGTTIHVLLHVVDGFLNELEVYREDSGAVQRDLSPHEFRLIVV